MNTVISRDTLDKAVAAAEQLKSRLLQRIRGTRRPGFQCNCGCIKHGEAEVVDLDYPTGEYVDQLGQYGSWTANLREVTNAHRTNYDYSEGITQYFTWAELHVIFREVFAPLGMPTSHLFADPYRSGTGFQGSGQTAVLTIERPLHFRPVGDLSKSQWLNAEVRIDKDVQGYAKGSLISCFIDPFAVHYGDRAGGNRNHHYACLARVEFAARLFDVDKDLPIVRVREVGPNDTSATVETNVGVEFYQP